MNLADSELNLASPFGHESQHRGCISSEGFESQVRMKRGNERLDRGLTVSDCICCQVNQLIRNNFLFRGSLSFNGREAPSFSLPGSTEGARVLVHSCVVPRLGHHCKPKVRNPTGANLAEFDDGIALNRTSELDVTVKTVKRHQMQ